MPPVGPCQEQEVTISSNQWVPVLPHMNIQQKMTVLTGKANIEQKSAESVCLNEYVACCYHGKWWIGVVEEVDKKEQHVKVNFLHPSGPARSFWWPRRPDICWVAITDVICEVQARVTTKIYSVC